MSRIENHPVLKPEESRKSVSFTFNGNVCEAYEGEMVSSALFANGFKEFSIHKKDNASQGIFCANGQCAQCTVIVDGMPLKSCVTPLRGGMDIRTMKHVPKLPEDDRTISNYEKRIINTDVLVVGGGPSGLTAAVELARHGFRVVIADDKNHLGGKLLLQTHKFFGSEEDCYAGTRGIDIAEKLEDELKTYDNVEIYTESPVVGIYKDQKAGIFVKNREYILVNFEGLVVATGAREKSIVFPGNDLPGVYGAGAFQTLVNRDLIRAADKIMIVGSGNVGLIAAYHALQAGIHVAGIVEIAPDFGGYKVHADKIRRMGVPLYLNTTVLSVDGDEKVERITIAEVDENWNPVLETAKTFSVDTVLVAAGLSSADEFFEMADSFDFHVVKTGDAEEIAEASSAMFGGRIAGLKMARALGEDVVIDDSWYKKAEVLKSMPGEIYPPPSFKITEKFQPKFTCVEEIPCNPCTTVCPKNAIHLREKTGSIMDNPYFDGECVGCGVCVAACPGLAITLVRSTDNGRAEVMLPHEFVPDFSEGDNIEVTDMEGNILDRGEVKKISMNKKYKTWLITVELDENVALKAAGLRVQDAVYTKFFDIPEYDFVPENGIVCRCERITLGECVDFIKKNNVRDINQLKQIRVGMGACGSKTCSVQMPRVFKAAGVDFNEVAEGTNRPLSVEVPMFALINEKRKEEK